MWTYRWHFHGRQLLSVVRSEVQHHTSSVCATCCSVASHRQVQRLALHTLPPRLQSSPLPQSLNRHTAHGNRNEHTAALPHTHRHSREGASTGSTHRYLVVLLVCEVHRFLPLDAHSMLSDACGGCTSRHGGSGSSRRHSGSGSRYYSFKNT